MGGGLRGAEEVRAGGVCFGMGCRMMVLCVALSSEMRLMRFERKREK